ncbi:MAG: DUF86 domain-containing protein [Magnetospirillum sp. WYHS-4]
MDRLRALERLEHILDAISAIEGFVTGLDLGAYRANRLVRDAVERNMERLSEASRHIPHEFKETRPEIDWRGVADIGNVLRHAYTQVIDHEIWTTVKRDLPPLAAAVSSMIERLRAKEDASP